jgi:hypothetical protein
MNRNALLRGSVSTVAIMAAGAAHAADLDLPKGYVETSAPAGFIYSVEGGLLVGHDVVAEDKLGDFDGPFPESDGVIDIGSMIGGRAAISLGTKLDPNWDVRGTLAINRFLPTHSSVSYEGEEEDFFDLALTTQFNFETLDFEAGYTPNPDDDIELRLFAGIRGLHYSDHSDTMAVDKLGEVGVATYESTANAEFIGVGPRVGADVAARLGDSNFGLSGMAAAAAIYGVERSDFDATVSIIPGPGGTIPIANNADEEFKFVYNLEGALGLDYYLNDQTKVTLGYRGEALLNVGSGTSSPDDKMGGDGESETTTRFVHGPTLKLSGSFD